MLEALKDIAFRFQIDPTATVGHAARISSVISVLQAFNQSYLSFLEVEFFKNEAFEKAYQTNPKVLDSLKADLELLIVDLKFGSFEAAAAPNLLDATLFNESVNGWKKKTFQDYKEDVLYANYFDIAYVRRTVDRFTDEERSKIYKPLFAVVGPDRPYRVNILDKQGKTRKVLSQPKGYTDFYVPKLERISPPEDELHTVQFVAQVRKSDDYENYPLNKRNIKQVLFAERLEHNTYPFKPKVIVFEDTTYILSEPLVCEVNYDDESYIIRNERLDLTVWGDSRDEAETAFSFAFDSLYQNFAEESDELLSDDAKSLKSDLSSLVKIKK
ncbi:hypothetical protein [Spirosoma luteum]|uniref:hypothetical protein n=1 Tax=Spirosoma luteum TaxID=431553 RepID=UPI00036A848C|nr:hypothetical protein [Spirosoma luteum]